MANNKCGNGFCSCGFDSACVKICQTNNFGTGLDMRFCKALNGRCIEDGVIEMKLTCCPAGCSMTREQYVQWNGLCAYAGE